MYNHTHVHSNTVINIQTYMYIHTRVVLVGVAHFNTSLLVIVLYV